MSETFAGEAVRLCGFVCRELGWLTASFWSATPQEIACILAPESDDAVAAMDRKTLDTLMERDAHG